MLPSPTAYNQWINAHVEFVMLVARWAKHSIKHLPHSSQSTSFKSDNQTIHHCSMLTPLSDKFCTRFRHVTLARFWQ